MVTVEKIQGLKKKLTEVYPSIVSGEIKEEGKLEILLNGVEIPQIGYPFSLSSCSDETLIDPILSVSHELRQFVVAARIRKQDMTAAYLMLVLTILENQIQGKFNDFRFLPKQEIMKKVFQLYPQKVSGVSREDLRLIFHNKRVVYG